MTFLKILNFFLAAHVSLIQNESYQQSPEKTKNNVEHKRQYCSFTNAIS